MNNGVKISPSILSADFSRLGEHVNEASKGGADLLHIDVMDGHFVQNITIGPCVIKKLRSCVDLEFDVHLMIENPGQYLADYKDAGADWLTVHVETLDHLHGTLQQIKALGMKPGVSLNPATSLSTIEEVMAEIDLLLIMTVNPGFGGQKFIPLLDKIRRAARMREEGGHSFSIMVDGGICVDNIAEVVKAGTDMVVAGSAVFGGTASVAENIRALKNAAGGN